MNSRVVVTGLGVISSIGIGKDTFWNNVKAGVSGVSAITAFDTSRHETHMGGEVKDFIPEDFIDRRKTRFIGRASQMAIAAARLALQDARMEEKCVCECRAGVCLGTTGGEMQAFENADQPWIKSGVDSIDKVYMHQYPAYNLPAQIATEFKAKGRNRIFTNACASGNYALGYGYDLIRFDKADMMIVGGSDAFSWIVFTGFNKLGATAPEKCQPFDKNRQGMIPAEGAGILILEKLEDALERSAPIYAEISGYGLSCDAYHMTNPQVEGISECMAAALADAGIKNDAIDYISAHGTGTPHNDRTECAAIKNIFGERRIPVSALKSMLGHTMGAASAIEAVACSLTVKNDIIPPTINYETPDEECDIDCVPNTAREQKVMYALNNGFAFGGNNCCVVIKKFS